MASMSDIRHSIRSVSDMEQITRAMHLISTSKMRKAVSKYETNHTHFVRVRATMKDILKHTRGLSHPYLTEGEGGKAAYVVIAADKGLCGGYNHNVLNLAYSAMQKKADSYILTVGQEARVFFERKGYTIDVEFLHVAQNPSLYYARGITMDLLGLFDSGIMNEVYVVYTHFISAMRQEPRVLKLLPLSVSNFQDVEEEAQYNAEMFYHPSPGEVFDTLVPQYIIGLVYGCLVSSLASEQCARMIAMESATNNAEERIADLTMQYNRARQAAITAEISEIIGALEALS